MSLVQLFVPTEVAHDTVSELGELGNVQFKDVCFDIVMTSVERPDRNPTAQPQCKSFPAFFHW
jgi:hypothetical protein